MSRWGQLRVSRESRREVGEAAAESIFRDHQEGKPTTARSIGKALFRAALDRFLSRKLGKRDG